MLNLFGKNVFARKRKAKAMPIDCGSAIESLEVRVVPVVNAVFTNGSLFLYGTGVADTLTIDFTATNQVTLTGASIASAGPITGNIVVDMGNGADVLHVFSTNAAGGLDSGDLIIDLGSGNDTMDDVGGTSPIEFSGNVSIVGGTGNDTVDLGVQATELLDLTIDLGTGAGELVAIDGLTANGNVFITSAGTGAQSVTFGAAAASTIAGNLTVTQASGASSYVVSITDTDTDGNVTITTGTGAGADSAAVSLITSDVDGTTTITNGDHDTNAVTITGASTLAGRITVTNGAGSTSNAITVDGLVASGGSSATFTNGSGPDNDITLGDTTTNDFIGTVAATNNSSVAGDNDVTVGDGTIARGLKITNGANPSGANPVLVLNNTVSLGDAGATLGVTGTISITNANTSGTGANAVSIDDLTTTGATSTVTIRNGSSGTGNTAVTLGAAGANVIAGNLSIQNLASTGTRTVTIDDTDVTGRTGVAINSVGAGNTTIEIGTTTAVTIDGKLDVQDGTATSTLTAEALTVGSITYNDLGGGSDTINLGQAAAGLTVNGVTRINTGNGSDALNIGGAGAVFNGLVSVSLGSGNDTVDIGAAASSPAFSSANRYQFDGGAGDDTFNASQLSLSDYELPLPRKLRSKITNFETLGF